MIICYCELAEWCDNPEHNGEVIYFDEFNLDPLANNTQPTKEEENN